MRRVKKLFSDEEVVGERKLPIGTTVEATLCIKVDEGWLALISMAGAIVRSAERPAYQEPEDDYEGAIERVMPREPWPPGERFANGHPRTLKLDPHTEQIGDEVVTARWMVQHVHPIPVEVPLDV